MRASAKVTSKGQVTIPIEVRKALDIEPGDRLTFIVRNGDVNLARTASWVTRTAGMFRDAAIQPPPTAKQLRSMASDAIAEAAVERANKRERKRR